MAIWSNVHSKLFFVIWPFRITEEFVEFGRQSLKDARVLVSLIEDNERRVQNGLAHELPPEFPEFQNHLNTLMKEYVGKLHYIWYTLIHSEMDFNEQMEVNK